MNVGIIAIDDSRGIRQACLPACRQLVFRTAVVRESVTVADILHVWLDVGSHSTRGEEQAEEIRHRAMMQSLDEKQ